MVQLLWLARDKVLNFLRDARAQDTFEYLMVTGVVVVAILAAAAALSWNNMAGGIVDGVCAAVDTVLPGPALDCTP